MAKKKTPVKTKTEKQKTNNSEKSIIPGGKNGEIVAICLIALSIFFGISVYTHSGGFIGDAISGLLKGLFGYCAYILPIIMAATIICYLFVGTKKVVKTKIILTYVAFLDLTAIFHMLFMSNNDIELTEYFSNK